MGINCELEKLPDDAPSLGGHVGAASREPVSGTCCHVSARGLRPGGSAVPCPLDAEVLLGGHVQV